jgi:hypothetical protein
MVGEITTESEFGAAQFAWVERSGACSVADAGSGGLITLYSDDEDDITVADIRAVDLPEQDPSYAASVTLYLSPEDLDRLIDALVGHRDRLRASRNY